MVLIVLILLILCIVTLNDALFYSMPVCVNSLCVVPPMRVSI